MSRSAICFTLLAMIFAMRESRAADVPEPEDYRLEDYRKPTPATLRGAKMIHPSATSHQISAMMSTK